MHNHRLALTVGILLLLAVVLVFGQTTRHGFVNFDDDLYVYGNPQVPFGLTAEGVRWAFTQHHASNWHPVTWLSHMLDAEWYGMEPWGHHLTNVLLHAATAIGLFLMLRQMTSRPWLAALVAGVFAVHPLRAESVAWVAERKDVLSGLFFVSTLIAYAAYTRRPFSIARYLLVVALFALGLMAKPMLVTLPFVLILLDYWPLGRLAAADAAGGQLVGPGRRVPPRPLLEKLPLLLLSVVSCIATLAAQHTAIESAEKITFAARIANSIVAYAAYVGQFFVPTGLAAFYPYPEAGHPAWSVAVAVLVLSAVTVAAIVWRRHCPALAVGWLWYLGMLVPVIGLVQVGSQAMADRYTYLPQVGLAVALVWVSADIFGRWPARRGLFAAVAALALVVLAALAWRQTSYWIDSETLWTRTLACTSRNHVAHNNLGNVFFEKGMLDDAQTHYEEALKIHSDHPEAHNNLGVILQGQGRLDEAIEHFEKCLAIDSKSVDAHNNLGLALIHKGRLDEAIEHCEKALAAEPRYAAAHCNYAVAMLRRGKIDEAIAHWQEAVEIDPRLTKAHSNLGFVLLERGQVDEAIEHCRRAIELDARFAEAHNNLANALCRKGQADEAIEHYRKALQLKPDFAEAHVNFGIALHGQGKAAEAAAQWDEALRLRGHDAAFVEIVTRLRAALGAAPAAKPPSLP